VLFEGNNYKINISFILFYWQWQDNMYKWGFTYFV